MNTLHLYQRATHALCFTAVLLSVAVSGCRTHTSGPAADTSARPSSEAVKSASPALIEQGKRIFDQTPVYAAAYVGNKLACSDCHIGSGTVDFAAPMLGLAGLFPMYSKRAGHVISLQNRIQECFARSESGKPLPEESAEMHALVAYISSLSGDGEKGKPYKGRGLVKIPALDGNPAAGKVVYAAQCAACHGKNGAGVPPVLPALWGKDSYNNGAGIDQPAKMAAYVIHNMPQTHPGILTPQQSYDVAAYIHTKPRPKFNEAYKSY